MTFDYARPHKMIDGIPVALTQGEIDEAYFQRARIEKENRRSDVIKQIVALEAEQTQRRIREATLTDEGKLWLADLETQIAHLREKL